MGEYGLEQVVGHFVPVGNGRDSADGELDLVVMDAASGYYADIRINPIDR